MEIMPYLFMQTNHVGGLVGLPVGSGEQGIEIADMS